MAITAETDVLAAALWPQGDERDPLGVWGFREGVTGDGGGGSIKVTAAAPAGLSAAYVYTCYSVLIAQLTGVLTSPSSCKCRLLANWPNIDTLAGVQGYGSGRFTSLVGGVNFTAPITIPLEPMITAFDRFILLFDPRPGAGRLEIVELELDDNVMGATYSFEGYGYWWDRSVLQAPGGPRHPGAQ